MVVYPRIFELPIVVPQTDIKNNKIVELSFGI